MHPPLSAQAAALVRGSAPLLQKQSQFIGQQLFGRLIKDVDIGHMFVSQMIGRTSLPEKLATAIIFYAQNIDRMTLFARQVGEMAQRHVAAGVRPEHYKIMAASMLAVIGEALGLAATREVMDAWEEAYWVLAHVLMEEESRLRSLTGS